MPSEHVKEEATEEPSKVSAAIERFGGNVDQFMEERRVGQIIRELTTSQETRIYETSTGSASCDAWEREVE